jgi:hypothetical protein
MHKYDNTIIYEAYLWSKKFEGHKTEYFYISNETFL